MYVHVLFCFFVDKQLKQPATRRTLLFENRLARRQRRRFMVLKKGQPKHGEFVAFRTTLDVWRNHTTKKNRHTTQVRGNGMASLSEVMANM